MIDLLLHTPASDGHSTPHSADQTAHYPDLGRRLGLCVTGGSDYHADPDHGPVMPGAVTLPVEEFQRLEDSLAGRANR